MTTSFSLVAAGNTTNPALLVLQSKGYDLRVEAEGDDPTLYVATRDGRRFAGYSAAEVLGLVTLWEAYGDGWNKQEPDLLGELLEANGRG
jgi:hypothetical protein